jgi:hypothetical protein
MEDLLERRLPLETSLRDLEVAEKAEVELLFIEQFQEVLDRWPGLVINYSYGITFNRPHPDYSYDKELMNIYFKEKWDQSGGVHDLKPGYYTTSTVDEWELDRLEIIGQVIECFRRVKEILLLRLTEIRTGYGPKKTAIHKQIWAIEAEVLQRNQAIHARKLSDGREKLFGDGLTYPEVEVEFLSRYSYTYGVLKATATKVHKYARTYKVTLLTKHGINVDYERVKEGALDRLVQMSNEFKAE